MTLLAPVRTLPLDAPVNLTRELARLVLVAPAYVGLLWLEDRLAPWLPLRIPRTLASLVDDPARLGRLLTGPTGPLPDGATVVAVERRGRLANEPDKSDAVGAVEVVYRHAGATRRLPIFLKFRSGRTMPVVVQGVRAAMEPGVAREVGFYRHLAERLPIRVPRAWHVDAVPSVNRVVLVLEHIDGWNPADWHGCPLPLARSILTTTARANAALVAPRPDDPVTAWVPGGVGLDLLHWVRGVVAREPGHLEALWTALRRSFDDAPLTLAHGDCRPGNTLFPHYDGSCLRDAPLAEHEASPWVDGPLEEVVVLDWEGLNRAPLLWDFTYFCVVGLRVGDRRRWQARLLDEFLDTLAAEGVDPAWLDPAQARSAVRRLTLALLMFGWAIEHLDLWNRWGSSARDQAVWVERFTRAAEDLDVARVAADIGVPVAWIEAFYERSAATTAAKRAARGAC